MGPLPRRRQPVTLRDADGGEHSSVVLGHEDGLLVLVGPADVTTSPGSGAGRRWELSWPGERAMLTLPVEVVEVRTDAEPVLWLARATGEVGREQRRDFVRVTVGSAMTLQREGEVRPATLLDVSEAGLRARVEEGLALEVGSSVRVGFSLDGTGFVTDAEVLRISPRREGVREVVLVFALEERPATELRRAVFGEQIRQRRLLPEG